jgi:MFS family permease
MRQLAAIVFVFLGGFAVMVLEIVGARFLARDFGNSFYVWVSQIGVILGALAAGYYLGGALADRLKRASKLAWLLVPAGVFTVVIPDVAGHLTAAIVLRHPADEPIPLLWQKLDPALGSAVVFFLPCLVLAMLAPYTIRLASRRLAEVGRISGTIYAASTVGSIAGVFISGYVLIDHFGLTAIFRGTGGLTLGLGVLSLFMDRWLTSEEPSDLDES